MPYTRPKGDARFQGISASRIGLPSLELDNEFNALAEYLNSLGSYTANVSEWVIFDPVPTYLAANQFTAVGDHTETFLPFRAIIAFLGATPIYTTVESASYAAGPNLTTVTVRDASLTASLSQVKYGLLSPEMDKLSIPITALTVPVVSKSVDYVATIHDAIILVDASAAARSITLPQVSLVSSAARGRKYMVVKTDSSLNHVTVVANAGDSINGAANFVLVEQYQRAELWGHGGTDWKQVARKTVPAGVMQMFGGAAAPSGWLLCNGAAVSRTTYADLYAAIGTVFGTGDGATTFNLPDLRGRAPIGVGTGTGLTTRALADKVGEENHVLIEAELPAHKHSIDGHSSASVQPAGGPTNVTNGLPYLAAPTETALTGSDTAHNTMQPSLAINFIIKV